jgi:hypothetical protein
MDDEFRTAYTAFLRDWGVAQGKTEEEFEEMVDQLVSQGGALTDMLKSFRAEYGRYPTFEELFPPGGPVVGMLEDL